jgi:hypothetical protein
MHREAGELNGRKAPVRINGVMPLNSFEIQDHKIIGWM